MFKEREFITFWACGSCSSWVKIMRDDLYEKGIIPHKNCLSSKARKYGKHIVFKLIKPYDEPKMEGYIRKVENNVSWFDDYLFDNTLEYKVLHKLLENGTTDDDLESIQHG